MLLPIVLGFSPHLPVSVCGTGNRSLLSGFSRQRGISNFDRNRSPHQSFETGYVLHYIPIYLPCPGSSSFRVCLSFCVPASFKRFRSVQESQPVVHRLRLYVLGLGPDLPWVDEPSPGNLRLSTEKILTSLSLLIPAFSLLLRPHVVPVMLLPTTLRSPTTLLL